MVALFFCHASTCYVYIASDNTFSSNLTDSLIDDMISAFLWVSQTDSRHEGNFTRLSSTMSVLNWTADGPTGSPGFEPGIQTDWIGVLTGAAFRSEKKATNNPITK
jgi:hypothetical protein